MQENQLTFEEVNEQIESADLSDYQKGGKKFVTAEDVAKNPADVLKTICGIYKIVRPILAWIVNILPGKWKNAVKTFMALCDSLCY